MHRSRSSANASRLVATTSAIVATAFAAAGCVPPAELYSAKASAAEAQARSAIAGEQSLNAASIPVNTVTVVPLTVLSSDTAHASLGHGLAALLAADLGSSARLTVVERLRLDAVLRELQLGQSGRVDTATAPRVGRLLGARQIVLGTVDLRSAGALRLDSRVADAVSGALTPPLTGNATLNQLLDAEKDLAQRLLGVLGITLTPAERRKFEQRPTRSLNAFLAFSRGVRSEASRDFAGALTHYSTALRLDPGFAAAGQRLGAIQGSPVSMSGGATGIERAAAISNELVNRAAPLVIGTGADAAIVSRQQLVTLTIIIRTP